MLEASVDHLGGTVGGMEVVEVGRGVGGSFGQGTDLLQAVGDGLLQGADGLLHQVLSQTRVVGPVDLDQALVEASS